MVAVAWWVLDKTPSAVSVSEVLAPAAAVSVFERYNGPYSQEMRPFLDIMMNKRIVVRVDPVRVRSWDHRKLGQPAMPLAGSTAEFLGSP